MAKDQENQLAFNVWNFILLVALFWTGMEVPLSYLVLKDGSHQPLILDLVLSLIFALNFYLHRYHHFSVIKMRHQFENVELKKNQKINTLFMVLEILSIFPIEIILMMFPDLPGGEHLRLIRLLRLIKLGDFFQVKDYLPKLFQVHFIIFGVITSINAFACVWMLLSPTTGLSFSDEYIRALYWAVTTLTTVGYGDITPDSNPARFFTMFTMMTGVSSFALIIGNLSRLLMLNDQHQQEHKNKMSSMQALMNHYQVPSHLKQQVFHYYHHLLEKSAANEDIQILKDLPMGLRQEIQLYMKIKLMKGIEVFENSELDCLKMVAQHLEEHFFVPGECIVKTGDDGNEMYLISHGKVEIRRSGSIVTELKAGSIFGEMALIENKKRSADIISKNYCDIFVLKKDDFQRICMDYPDLKKAFMDIYGSRVNENDSKA